MGTTGDAPAWPEVLKRLAIWAGFFALLYLARDFFFVAFMTFLFSYMTLSVVGWGMRRLSPARERGWLRRLLTVGVFVLAPLALLGVGVIVAPRLIEQGQRLAGWLSQVTPETEVTRLAEGFVAPRLFAQTYGRPGSPAYQQGLAEFRGEGTSHVKAYQDFPHLEAWVEGSFRKQFDEQETARLRARLAREGTSSQGFAQWFQTVKAPELQKQARAAGANAPPLVRAAAAATPEQLLVLARNDPAALAPLRDEWTRQALERGLADARGSPAYHEQLREHYDELRARSPATVPYTYEQYIELQRARAKGPRVFGEVYERLMPTAAGDGEARLRADFEAAKKHELFQHWWATSAPAQFVRRQVAQGAGGGGSEQVDRVLRSFLNVPVDLATALLLSLFICLDYPRLKRSVQALRETWLRDVYDEVAPLLAGLGQLVARAMHAQGLIALCNAVMIFVGLSLIGVEHEVLLAGAVFVLCLVPTLGAMVALVVVTGFALVQPGGGAVLAAKAAAVVALVIAMESLFLSPRILGKMMELHPVLIIALLPIAQYFFGVWGLILGTPVAVYVIHVLILRRGLPGQRPSG